MVVNESAEYPEPDEDEESNEELLHKPESFKSILPRASPPPQKVVQFCPLPGQVRHLKWWLIHFFADNLDIFYMFAEMGNDERTEMQLKFQDSPNPSVFVTTPKVGGTGLNLTAANHAVITSVSNGSGLSLWVRLLVQTELLPNWPSGSSTNPNCPLGYGSMANSQPV